MNESLFIGGADLEVVKNENMVNSGGKKAALERRDLGSMVQREFTERYPQQR